MQGIARTVILAAAFGLMLWYALAQSPEDPAPSASTSRPADTDDDAPPGQQQGWSREERAIWRDTVNQRLGR
jgi:hypothetical protein